MPSSLSSLVDLPCDLPVLELVELVELGGGNPEPYDSDCCACAGRAAGRWPGRGTPAKIESLPDAPTLPVGLPGAEGRVESGRPPR